MAALTPGQMPFDVIMGLNGRPLNGGRVYIGEPNKDPEQYPQPVFWNADGAVSAAQPFETSDGYVVRAGTPARWWTTGAYSITVRDRQGRQVWHAENVEFELPDGAVTEGAITEEPGEQTKILRKIGAVQCFATIAGMTASGKSDKSAVVTVEESGGGQFVWVPASTRDPDGGLVFAADEGGVGRWERLLFGHPVTPLMFGAKGDGTADDTAQVKACVEVAAASWLKVSLAGRRYRLTAKVNFATNLDMEGPGSFIVDHPGVGIGRDTSAGAAARMKLRNFSILARQAAATAVDADQFQFVETNGLFIGKEPGAGTARFTTGWKQHNVAYWGVHFAMEIEAATRAYDLKDANDTYFFGCRHVRYGSASNPDTIATHTVYFSGGCSGIRFFGLSCENVYKDAEVISFHPDCEENLFTGLRIECRGGSSNVKGIAFNGARDNTVIAPYILGATVSIDSPGGNRIDYMDGFGGGYQFMGLGSMVLPTYAGDPEIEGAVNFNTSLNRFRAYLGALSRSLVLSPAIENFNMNGHAITGASAITPAGDGSAPCGGASNRFNAFYATTGTIQTSDEREKQWRGPLTAAELAAAREISQNIGIYQWLSAIAEKGAGGARLHVGLKAQHIASIMQAHGLDPARYGFFCYDEWDEHTEFVGDAERTVPAGNRYSIRPDELLFFIAAALEQRLAALESA